MKVITLQNGKKFIMNQAYLTVKRRREINLKFKKPETVVLNKDAEILERLEKEYKETPPTQQKIYEDYTSLVGKNPEEEVLSRELLDECCRACMKWQKPDGKEGAFVTEEEFDEMPHDVIDYMTRNLFTNEERSFLVAEPE